MALPTLLLAGLLLGPAAAPGAKEGAEEGIEEGRAALDSLAEKHRELKFLSAHYVQERRTPLMRRPLLSEGRLSFRRDPGCLIFHTEKPKPTVMRLDAETYEVHRPHKQQLERFRIEDQRWQKALFQTLSHQVAEIEKDFDVLSSSLSQATEEQPAVRNVLLKPRTEKLARKVRSLEIAIRSSDSLVTRIAYVDGNGDQIALLLSDIEVEKVIEPQRFELKVPEGTRILTHEAGDGSRP